VPEDEQSSLMGDASTGRLTFDQRYSPDRRQWLFIILTGLFVTHALLGELIGGKLISVGGQLLSVGVIPWPMVFVTTDLVNEYYGPRAVRRLTFLCMGLILYSFCVLFLCMAPESAIGSPVGDSAFRQVFGQSLWIILGSVTAFAVSQMVDVWVFLKVARRTGHRMLWARAVGSTVVSQLVDTFVINAIAFGLSGKLTMAAVVSLSMGNYIYKFVIAIGTLPLVYLGHKAADYYLQEA
jgi:uncharacterized integral membrane protein (TIGR00697 family)